VQGNYIGTDVTGTRALGNGTGVFIIEANTRLGGTEDGSGNLISGNRGDGVLIWLFNPGQVIQGNFIGTDCTGTRALGNARNGVHLEDLVPPRSDPITIRGNLISGNQQDGIFLTGNGHTVQGNLIGTDVTGTVAVGNVLSGVSIHDGSNIQIGGMTAQERNVISGNQ